jgi:hypothetical protein
MNFDQFPKRQKKPPLELQLTAMIDVFSMIVIFLIFGTVFGAADITVPAGMRIPQSISKEGLEAAPKVMIERDGVTTTLIAGKIALNDFRSPDGRDTIKKRLKSSFQTYEDKTKQCSTQFTRRSKYLLPGYLRCRRHVS